MKRLRVYFNIVGVLSLVFGGSMSFTSTDQMLQALGMRAYQYDQQEKVTVVPDCKTLGKLAALYFLRWVQHNPQGVISFPTGKTPEKFIHYLQHYKRYWHAQYVQDELHMYGIDGTLFPDTSQLKFVQMDEFFFMTPQRQNSFSAYVQNYYCSFLGIAPCNQLLIDFSCMGFDVDIAREIFEKHRYTYALLEKEAQTSDERYAQDVLRKVQQFCTLYEEKIAAWGGIDFFLGGIGPEGHIAFNMAGAKKDSVTRIVAMNYQTAAAAATSLGGIEYARDAMAVTIGLQTILRKPTARIVIMAAGEVKAPVIAQAVDGNDATVAPGVYVKQHPQSCFFVTQGAAKHLKTTHVNRAYSAMRTGFFTDHIDEIIMQAALQADISLDALTLDDIRMHEQGSYIIEKYGEQGVYDMVQRVKQRLIQKIEQGMHKVKDQSILHTAPHHDDVMLSYHAYALRHLSANRNWFAYLTSGFNSVADQYLRHVLKEVTFELIQRFSVWIFQVTYDFLLEKYRAAFEVTDEQEMERVEQIIALRTLSELFECDTEQELAQKIIWLKKEYLASKRPGEKDAKAIQTLKGRMRESEVDRMWVLAGVKPDQVVHFRSHFYNGDYFTPMPTVEHDVLPVLDYMKQIEPTVITVALDPEGTGPDTHYKVLQLVAKATAMYPYKDTIEVWGYRNVWHHFDVHEATRVILVDNEDMAHMEQVFLNCFSTQKQASFPALQYDGPFSGLVKKVQQEQFAQLQTLLGKDYFATHFDAQFRQATGAIFLKTMPIHEFLAYAQHMRHVIEG